MKYYQGTTTVDNWSSFNWVVTIKGQTLEHKLGIGHIVYPALNKDAYGHVKTRTLGVLYKVKPKDALRIEWKSLSQDIRNGILKHLGLKLTKWNDEAFNCIYIKKPKYRDVIWALAMDAQVGSDTFEDFCGNCGYDTDSRKALDTYLACQEAVHTLRKLGYDMQRILEWEL